MGSGRRIGRPTEAGCDRNLRFVRRPDVCLNRHPGGLEASAAEVINRWVHQAPVSMRRGPRVREIREDQVRKARERRARIFSEHEWVEVPNARPLSEPGLATEPVEPGFDAAKTKELFPEARRIARV